jgi:nitrate reductase beta subunit
MNTLKKLYREGSIPYPRVENGYIQKTLYSYFPHPELPIINDYFLPLKQDYYKYDENSLLLHLHNLRYINMSQVETTIKRIKKWKNSSNHERTKTVNTLSLYKDFVAEKGETDLDYFLKDIQKHYSDEKPRLEPIDYNSKNFLEDIQKVQETILNKDDFIANQEKNTIITNNIDI